MTFARPEWLALVALVAIAAWAVGRRDRFAIEASRRFARRGAIAGVRPRRGPAVAAAALIAIAAAGPRVGEELRELPVGGLEVVIAIDASRSMLVRDVLPDRLSRARREATDLARRLVGARVGLVTIGGEGEVRCPLTRDARSFASFVDEVAPERVARGGTDLGSGLRAAVGLLGDGRGGARRVVLFSDGGHLGAESSLDEGIDAALAAGVVVHAVLVGAPAGGPVPIGSGADEHVEFEGREVTSVPDAAPLRRIAAATGGAFCDAAQPFPAAWLEQQRLGAASGSAAAGASRLVPVDRYQWFLGAGLLLLGIASTRAARVSRGHLVAASTVSLVCAAPLLAAWVDGRALAEEAARRFAAGEPAVAAELLVTALDDAETPEAARYNLGVATLRSGDPAAAVEWFEPSRFVDEELRASAAFGAGVARVALADRSSGRVARLAQLRAARDAFLLAAARGHGRDAVHNLEVVARRIEAMRETTLNGRPEPDEEGPDENEPRDETEEDLDGPGRSDGDPRPMSGSGEERGDADAASMTAAADEDPRLSGGMFKDHARSLFEIVERMRRERADKELRRLQASRSAVERDW